MSEVIFVIKLAITLGHKSGVLVPKKKKKRLNMPLLLHTVLLSNSLILLQILHLLRWGNAQNDRVIPSVPSGNSSASLWASRNDFLRCDVIYGSFSIKKANSSPSDPGAFASLLLLLIDSSPGRTRNSGC